MPSYKEIRNRLLIAGAKQIQPIIGEFELTSRCNFTCAMCYVKENLPSTDLTTRTWKTIFKAAVDAGMVYALLTGGEPFTRPDFTELYTFLFDMGVKITVYSNGSLLTDKIIETFTIRPPEFIGITLYGASD
ncbi:MAG: radical SAM protein, partial [Candidatus Izemoplasmatales bacterium]|nr:radical SAM protein [Candidatus Izemoplasmatales bacterium]